MHQAILVCVFCLPIALAQKYTGPQPPKPDVPYLVHADSLLETEVSEAREETRKDNLAYVVSGEKSSVRTPLAGPILLLKSEKIAPDKLQLYRVESKGGQREVVFSKKKKDATGQPIRLSLARLEESLYRIEVDESLENGEYCLSPSGENRVFCFQVY
ncbi:MAG: hypothetical protein WD696_20785 [Bryobacteraceae bacterium]